MSDRIQRPYGFWESPLTPASLAADGRLGGLAWDSSGPALVWLEGRGDDNVLVCDLGDGQAPRDLTRGRSVRAKVGYGGGDFCVAQGSAFFVDAADGRIWRQPLAGGEARAVTPAFGQAASPCLSPDGRWLVYVHHDPEGVDRLAVVDAEGRSWPQILAEGHDFYMQPRWSPDGRFLAYVAWDQPNMPWDGTLLYLAPVIFAGGQSQRPRAPRLGEARTLAGGESVAVFQPEFTPDGRGLVFVSDETGWSNLSHLDLEGGSRRRLTQGEAEHGLPAWSQDLRSYALADGGRLLYCLRGEGGFRRLYRIDLQSGETARVAALEAYSDVSRVVAASSGDRIALIASGQGFPARVLVYDGKAGRARVLARSGGEGLAPEAVSRAESLGWESGGERAEGLYYAPCNPRFASKGAPPLILWVHGGPSSQVTAGWNAWAQFLCSRGFSVLALNHRGSTGYGRAFQQALRGKWGQIDAEDAVSGALHLVAIGKADPARIAIMGGSAGGFTVLQALIRAPETFACGLEMFGVSDLAPLAASTHKFEARYLDHLVGPLPEAAAAYAERSPARQADRILRPLAIFQGADDRVVPRAQSDAIASSLSRRKVPHVYHVYEGEGHGWRRPETIAHFWQAVEDFLREHLAGGTGGAGG